MDTLSGRVKNDDLAAFESQFPRLYEPVPKNAVILSINVKTVDSDLLRQYSGFYGWREAPGAENFRRTGTKTYWLVGKNLLHQVDFCWGETREGTVGFACQTHVSQLEYIIEVKEWNRGALGFLFWRRNEVSITVYRFPRGVPVENHLVLCVAKLEEENRRQIEAAILHDEKTGTKPRRL